MSDMTNPQIMHFTHVSNLPQVIEHGLLADSRQPPLSVECADLGVKERRRTRAVPIPPGGVVADYVPFYFAPRSPMLYRISKGAVEGYDGDQDPLIYLGSRAARIAELGLPWVATDRNAAVNTAEFMAELDHFSSHVDWEVMSAFSWRNTPEDGSRMQRRMAEFLVLGCVPWQGVLGIVTRNEATRDVVNALLSGLGSPPRVSVRPDWYF